MSILSGRQGGFISTAAPRRQTPLLRRIADRLPRGWALTDESWSSRHRGILIVLWSHVLFVPVFGLIQGAGLGHVLLEASGIAVLATVATTRSLKRTGRTVCASIGLMTTSAVLVHLSGGSIEMHFHFFVMVPLVALYQEWLPFLVAIGFVVLHHGVAGTLDPQSVFNHPAAFNNPWKWAAIHALFITGTSAVCLTTWRLLETALNRARTEAQVKSEFLSVLSHEIRTPLTAIIGYTGLLADGELSEEQREFVNTVKWSSDHLLTLINDILDYSKLEAGRLELDETSFNVFQLVDDTVALVADQAHQKGLTLSSLCEKSVPATAVGDGGRIAQVLLNLLANAVKFTEEGEVHVRVTGRAVGPGRHEVTVAVRDTGIGIESDDVARLFGSFTQAEASTSRRFGGTGLGLAIAKHLCELMDGSITVESLLGGGSTFIASFIVKEGGLKGKTIDVHRSWEELRVLVVGEPHTSLVKWLSQYGVVPRIASASESLACARPGQRSDLIFVVPSPEWDSAELSSELRVLHGTTRVHIALVGAPRVDRPIKGVFDTVLHHPLRQSQVYDVLLSLASARHEASAQEGRDGATSATPARSSLRLLVAEDNHVNQKVLLSQLRRLGYAADTVANGHEALQASAVRHYDVILMDLHMPEMDGITAAWQIRERSNGRKPTIIAITADTTEEKLAACRDAGIDEYLTKPVDVGELSIALRTATQSMVESR